MLNGQLHDYDIRQSNKLHQQYYRTNYGTFSIQCKGTSLWNLILHEFKSGYSPQSLKKKVKQYLLNINQ